jgi:hypothetical protein
MIVQLAVVFHKVLADISNYFRGMTHTKKNWGHHLVAYGFFKVGIES